MPASGEASGHSQDRHHTEQRQSYNGRIDMACLRLEAAATAGAAAIINPEDWPLAETLAAVIQLVDRALVDLKVAA